MKIFNTICIDKETKGIMILEDVSYNNACCWLDKTLGEPISAKAFNEIYTIIKYPETEFIYDERRGYLIRKV